MKTRVISTDIWDEDDVFQLNIDTKLIYLILLTNPYIGQSRFYKISDRQISTFSGLNIEQIQKCKKNLEETKMAYFKDGYVCITGFGFVECFYKGEKNEKAKQNELEKIPSEIIKYFKDKMEIPYLYPIDTPLNTKSEIKNNKSRIIKEDLKKIFGEHRNVKLTDEELNKLQLALGDKNTDLLIEELSVYIASKGKRYASHYATLQNWARRKIEKHQENIKSNKYKVAFH